MSLQTEISLQPGLGEEGLKEVGFNAGFQVWISLTKKYVEITE